MATVRVTTTSPSSVGFTRVDSTVKRRLICAVSGREKTGKSHLALTAPGAIYYCNFDIGLEGLVDRFCKDKEIYTATYRYSANNKTNWTECWDQFKEDFTAAVAGPSPRTVVVDTFSEAWELARLARFGKLAQVLPHLYGPLNAEIRELVRLAFDGNANVIFIQKQKAVYVNDHRTGDYEPSGFGDLPYLVQANLITERVRVRDDDTGDEDWRFKLTVKDCRHNMALADMELWNGEIDFQVILDSVFGVD